MGYAELGVRVVLDDAASSGLDAIGLGFLNFGKIVRDLSILMMPNNGLSSGMKGLGVTAVLTGAAFEGLAGLMEESISAAGDLEQEIANLSVSVNGADQVTGEMSNTLVSLADNSIYSTATIADGFTTLGVDGWNARQILDGMGQDMITLAEATRSDMVPAANLLGTSMETYGAAAQDASKYTQDLTFMFYNGEKTVSNIQSALNQAAGTAHNAGISFDELSTALALLGEDGLKGSQGGSALRYMITALIDPTNKAAKELASLGIVVINDTNPALMELEARLAQSGKAGQTAVNNFDGTYTSLIQLYSAAQKLGLVGTDQTLMQWATATGVLTNKLFDANGNFIGIRNTIDQLGQSINNLNPQQKAIALQQLFNVRGAQAATRFLQDYQTTLQRFDQLDGIRSQTDAMEKAKVATSTLQGAIKQLSSTWTDTLARLGTADLGPLKMAAMAVWSVLHAFNMAGPQVQSVAAMVLASLTAFSGMAFAVTTVAFAIGLLGGMAATVGIIIGVMAITFLQVGAAVGVVAWAFQQAQDKTSGFGRVVKPIFDGVQAAFGFVKDQILNQLLPSLDKLGLNLNTLKIIGIVLLAVFVAPLILSLGIFIVTIVVVVTVVTKLVQAFLWIRDTSITVNNAIRDFVMGIPGVVKAGFDLVVNLIHNAVNTVVGWFSWLYAHNYYFQILVDTITNKVHEIQARIEAVLAAIRTIWNTAWTWVHDRVSAVWSAISTVFGNAEHMVSTKFNSIKTQITSIVGNIATVLLNSGKNMIDMLINGITSRIGALMATVGDIGKKIAGVLGFHSPPKEGPLSDSDVYMPNMMKMYANGIHSHLPLIEAATGKVAKAMTLPPGTGLATVNGRVGDIASTQRMIAGQVQPTNAGVQPGQGDIHIYIDGKEVTGTVMKRVTGDLRRNGVGRTMR